jgi:hypothetical protein
VGRATRRPERTGFRASVVPMVGPNERGFGLMGQF